MKEHVVADELLEYADREIQKGNNWLAYNEIPYFLDTGDMQFFKTSDEAHEYSANNISEYDCFRVLYAESVYDLLRQIPYGENILSTKKEIMNENNLAFLEKQLLNLGFGDHMNATMKKHIESERSEFNLQHTFKYGNREMLTDLSFKRGEENEMYFFNSFRATMKDEPNLSHTFYINKGNAITSKEAFNLLEGRAVNKDLVNKDQEKYNAWVQLDIKGDKDLNQNFKLDRYHQNYGYDLTKAMNELILKPMSVEEDNKLHASLLKGNVQSVTFLKNGEEVKGFIEANPKDRTIDIYDAHMKPLSKEAKQDFLDKEPAKEKVQQQQQKPAGDDLDDGKLKKKRVSKKSNGVKP